MYNNDIINSTDLNQRLEEIRYEEYNWIEDDSADTPADEDAIRDEYDMLIDLIEDGKSYNSEWDSGIDLINAEHFTDYIKQSFIELGIISQETLNVVVVDWDETASNAKSEYKELVIQDITYLIRIN